MAHGVWGILSALLFIRPDERIWDVPVLVCGTSTCRPTAINYFMDWIHSALGVLLFRKFSRTVPSTLFSLSLSGIALQGGFIGRIFDEFGPRVLMLVGTLIYVTSIMATSFATQYYQYVLSQGILFGLGVGML